MIDQRFHRLAAQVIDYSVSLKRGERLLIDVWDGADDLGEALMRAAYAVGGLPFLTHCSTRLERVVIENASEAYMEDWLRYQSYRMREMDAYIVVRKKENAHELEGIDPERRAIYERYYGKLHFGIRIPDTKWCVLRYPNPAMAQLAGMSTGAFEDYYFRACCLDYRRLCRRVEPLVRLTSRTDKVHIAAPGTDLTFSIKGLSPSVPRCGQRNVPCGELGMPVAVDSANGEITYNVPSEMQGTVFSHIHLVLRDGLIVEASSSDTRRMNEILDTDPNARRIGEFAMGFNPFLTRTTLDTIFDEKRAKTIHFTPGNSEINPSAIHWDIVQSHAAEDGGGEIWFDGVLIRKDGLFVPEELQPLNPENLIPYLEEADRDGCAQQI